MSTQTQLAALLLQRKPAWRVPSCVVPQSARTCRSHSRQVSRAAGQLSATLAHAELFCGAPPPHTTAGSWPSARESARNVVAGPQIGLHCHGRPTAPPADTTRHAPVMSLLLSALCPGRRGPDPPQPFPRSPCRRALQITGAREHGSASRRTRDGGPQHQPVRHGGAPVCVPSRHRQTG